MVENHKKKNLTNERSLNFANCIVFLFGTSWLSGLDLIGYTLIWNFVPGGNDKLFGQIKENSY